MLGSTDNFGPDDSDDADRRITAARLRNLVRRLARDLGGRGITVNGVQPGPADIGSGLAEDAVAESLIGRSAIKRSVKPAEIAAMVAYLASNNAAMVTAAVHRIDGGYSL